jgi:hypothetical protein
VIVVSVVQLLQSPAFRVNQDIYDAVVKNTWNPLGASVAVRWFYRWNSSMPGIRHGLGSIINSIL